MKHLAYRPVFSAAALVLVGVSVLLPLSGQAADGTGSADRQRALQAEAKALRQAADENFKAQEKACYEKFLVNHCIDQARKERLERIRQARALEAEARQLKLAEREQAAAATLDKQAQSADSAAGTVALPPEEAAAAAQAAPVAIPSSTPLAMPAATDHATSAEREARAAEKAAATQAKQAQRDAERTEKRARSEAQAAERAAAAERDRARYDRRLEQRAPEQTGE